VEQAAVASNKMNEQPNIQRGEEDKRMRGAKREGRLRQ